jgi:hypothetical protein
VKFFAAWRVVFAEKRMAIMSGSQEKQQTATLTTIRVEVTKNRSRHQTQSLIANRHYIPRRHCFFVCEHDIQCPADKADAAAPQCATENVLPVFCPKKISWGLRVSAGQ